MKSSVRDRDGGGDGVRIRVRDGVRFGVSVRDGGSGSLRLELPRFGGHM